MQAVFRRVKTWWCQMRYRAALRRLHGACLEVLCGAQELRPLVTILRREERQRFASLQGVGFPEDCVRLLDAVMAEVAVIATGRWDADA